MAAGTEFSHPFINVESGYSNVSSEVSEVQDVTSDNSEELKQTLNGKPPRNLSVVRHSQNWWLDVAFRDGTLNS